MAGDTGVNQIYYWSNNGIDSNKVGLTDTTAPGFGRSTGQVSFTRPSGKSFIKWNTAADGTGTDYFPGDNVESLLAQNADLYAIWGDILLIVQKSSIEDIADITRSKALLSTDQTLASLPTAINSILCPTGRIAYQNFNYYSWSNGMTLSTIPNSINITNFPLGTFILFLSLNTSSYGYLSSASYAIIFYDKNAYSQYHPSGWVYHSGGYGSPAFVISSDLTNGVRRLSIKTGSGTLYIQSATIYYTELG